MPTPIPCRAPCRCRRRADTVADSVPCAVCHMPARTESYDTGMWSYFSHANERFALGYYATRLDRYGVDAAMRIRPRNSPRIGRNADATGKLL